MVTIIAVILNHDVWIKYVNNDDDSLARLYKCKFVFLEKRKKKIGKYTAKLIILWYDNFSKNHTPQQKNGMTAIPKIYQFGNILFVDNESTWS